MIIDVQKGFLTENTAHVPGKIRELLSKRKFDRIVATKFVNNEDSPYYVFAHWYDMMDTESQELDPYVKSVAQIVFYKNISSCFTEEFLKWIENEGIDKLYFVGIETDCCVLVSAYGSFDRKIPFTVLTDYCASGGGKEAHEAACVSMKWCLGEECIQ